MALLLEFLFRTSPAILTIGLAGIAGWYAFGWIGAVIGVLVGLPIGYWIETSLEKQR